MKIRASKRKTLFSIDLKENGGLTEFFSIEDFAEWTKHERRLWEWMTVLSDRRVPYQIGSYLTNRLDSIVTFAQTVAAAGSIEGHNPNDALNGHYGGDQPTLFHSRSATGQTILLIKEAFGEVEAAIAYALLVGIENFSFRNPLHFKLMGLIANPATIDVVTHIKTARGILGEASKISEEIHSSQRLLLSEAKSKVQMRDKQARELGRSTIRKLVWSNWRSRQKLMKSGYDTTQRMEQTRLAYEQAMQVRAAVNYWEEKRDGHAVMKKTAFKQLKYFLFLGGIAAIIGFATVAIVVLEASQINVIDTIQIANRDHQPAPVFFATIIALLGTLLTCLFWSARILVRNYLTERRLIADSEERRVMTKTFLALVNEGAAKEEDRLVVLNALFRPSSDIIGSEEGSLDIALPAMLAKLMDQRALR